MDALDRKILQHLQLDGRMSITDLAARVQLSTAACHRRFRDLERDGVITGFRAEVDRAAVGQRFEAVVSVVMHREDAETIAAFEAGVAAIPEVLHAERLFGEPDYLLRMVAADLEAFADLRDRKLATLAGVGRITSTIVMRRIVNNRPVPV